MTPTADAALREWVEQLSILLEQDGLPRMAGRVFGWLLVCAPPEQSMEELAAAVQGSKASMSTMTRLLVQSGLVEKVRCPGARRDGFRIRPGQWQQLWQARMEKLRQAAALTGRGLALLEGRPPAHRARLAELHDQYTFIGEHLPALLARMEGARGPGAGARPGATGAARNRRRARRIT